MKKRVNLCLVISIIAIWAMLAVAAPAAETSQTILFSGCDPGLSGPVDLRFRLFTASTGGTPVFEETQRNVDGSSGCVFVFIGDATPGGLPPGIFASNPSLWIAFAMDSDPNTELGGGRTPIAMAGYAAKAINADMASQATRANQASQADNATLAARATTADTATRAASADSATRATTAGRADTAARADAAARADLATRSTTADSAARATTADRADSAAVADRTGRLAAGTVGEGNVTINGNVGIGTTNPTYQLDVQANVNNIRLVKSNGGVNNKAWDFLNDGTALTARVLNDAATVATDWMVVNRSGTTVSNINFPNGNVGIGTGSPGGRLHVAGGNLVVNDRIGIGTTSLPQDVHFNMSKSLEGLGLFAQIENTGRFSAAGLGLKASTNNSWRLTAQQFGDDRPAGLLIQGGTTGGLTKIAIIPNGNVGIGVHPGLDPINNILTVKRNSATSPIADAWTQYSSRRWKTNIQTIKDPLEKVQRLRGVSFNWKEDGRHDIGLIAEEVGQVIPEVVAYEENGEDARSVDYARLVALLIEGMKEQHAQVRELKSEIERLKARHIETAGR
ncbi:MAG: tail fiber domain-containing protein [Acidobacteria bacterium]|nr:tail fiber domain-containing protein [Acidobacteriota bacterium]